MNNPDDAIGPPWLVQAVLRLLLRPASQESVPGDLLEEYRKSILPVSGTTRANLWYARQVAGFLWRISWPWGVLVGAQVVIRTLCDTFAPPITYGPRSAITTWVAVATFLLAGCQAAYRTGHTRSGILVALTAHAMGHLVAIVLTGILFLSVIQNDPRMLRLFRVTGDWGEVLVLPIMLLPIVATLGGLGGMLGKSIRWTNAAVSP